jgi:hypothetical protein
MYSRQDPNDRVSMLEMNSELEHAQVELLSAHCATHQLRLHYSSDDLACLGRRDLLRKSAEAASALNEFYSAIEKKIPRTAPVPDTPVEATSEQIALAVRWLSTFLHGQRDHYLPAAGPLSSQHQARMWPYFSFELLGQIRVLELQGARVAHPDFFDEARALGYEPPEISHMDSLTFLDVVVFNEQITERALFHALVHVVQIQVLGLERYAELWVRSFAKSKAHFSVPLEVHAFSLSSKFLRPSPERFSVEDQVRRWVAESRY